MNRKRFLVWALSICVFSVVSVVAPAQVARAQNVAKPQWQKMPLLSPEAARAGVFPGGEGSQWPRWDIEISRSDPNFMLLPIDVGGLYRSIDGGANWNQSSEGWNARGANSFAIDPKNSNRVLGTAGNSMNWGDNWGQSPHGVYLSKDKGATWQQVLATPDGHATIVVYDPSSHNAQTKQCDVAYFSSNLRGLFRSGDGGQNWTAVSRLPIEIRTGDNDPASLKIHPTKGTVYLGGKDGFHASTDGGKTWHHTPVGGSVRGVSVSASAPEGVWISGSMGAQVSRDGGKTFTSLGIKGIERKTDEAILNLNVSAVNSQKMLCWVAGENWKWVRYVSHDGGANWQAIKIEKGQAARDEPQNTIPGGWASLPYNVRNGFFAWHPTDENVVFGLGGDWVTKSSDGGRTFRWSNNGYNGVMLGQSLNFSAHDPNTVFLAFQDYNGAFTTDGGKTWNYRDVSGNGWGGHDYGGYAVDKNVMWCGDSAGWAPPRRTRISRDGGKTWDFAKDAEGKICEWGSAEISYSDPKNLNTLFASHWRSTDKGATWAKMPACDGVYISSPDGTLIGRKDENIVTSKDGGASWQTIVAVPGGFRDVAFDHKNRKYYAVSQERLKVWDGANWQTLETPKNQYGGQRVECVAVDPKMPEVVYGGGPNNVFANAATVFRSTDAGKTWANLTTGDGPHEVAAMRVHPITRDLWLNGQCYGMWRLAAPTVLGAAPQVLADAKRAPVAPIAVALIETKTQTANAVMLRNGDMSAGAEVPEGWGEKWGDIVPVRDTAVFRSAPASLRGNPNGKSGQAFQMFEVGGGGSYTILGFLKTQGDVKAQVVVQSFTGDWSKNDYNQIKYLQGDFDWQEFSKEITIPAWAGRFNVQLSVEGNGTAWLDDVKLVAKGGTNTVASTSTGEMAMTSVISDFGPANFNYNYGESWKVGQNIVPGESGGAQWIQIDATEHGGAGIVLNGVNTAPQQQTHLALRAKLLPGNKSTSLNANLVRNDGDGGGKTVTFDLSQLNETAFTTIVAPLGEGDFSRVQQLQLQGTNWSAGAQALKIQIDRIGTTTLDEKANIAAAETMKNDPTSGPPPKDKPFVAGWGFYPDFPRAWMQTANSFKERSQQGVVDIVFVGDSITQGWGDEGGGKAIFAQKYANRKAVNYGIGGDSTRQVLWRLQNGMLDGIKPKLVVLKIGTNNLYGDGNSGSDEEIARGITTIVSELRKKLPQTKILLLGILPRQNDYFSNRAKNINALIAKSDDGALVRFLDMSDRFQTEVGKVRPELYTPDQLHLSSAGYQAWAEAMEPMMQQLLQ